jgi:hypothetical protein
MIPSTGTVKLWPDGRANVDASLRLTGDSHIQCCTYEDRPPILSITDAHVSVTISMPDPEAVTSGDLAAARRLADAVTRYITELEHRAAAMAVVRASAA